MRAPSSKKNRLRIFELSLFALFGALLVISQVALSFLPNIELVSVLTLIFAQKFGKKVFYIIYTFVLVEGAIYGPGVWWIMYFYVWTILALVVILARIPKKTLPAAITTGAFGLVFGALCSIPYIFLSGPKAALAFYLAGIPYDITHCIGNFIITLALYYPLTYALDHSLAFFQSRLDPEEDS